MFARAFCLGAALAAATPVWATPTDQLLNAIGVKDVIQIMQQEGLAYGDTLGDELLTGGPDAAWRAEVARIYDVDKMEQTVRAGFSKALDGTDVTPLLAFFTSEEGQRIIELEVSARAAMVDEDVEETAREAYRAMSPDSDRITLVESFIEANDLIEANVAGALNASYQFYTGLVQGGALNMSEADVLRDVWGQEAETREDTQEWLFAYLLMAYGPLEDETLANYVALSSSDEGKALNRALFLGFNEMYDTISYALGLAAAREMQAQEL